jgi:uncharacterized protein (TIGR03545 family)
MIRWKAFIPVAIILGSIFIFYFFFLNGLLKCGFIKVNELAFGAKAEVDYFHFQISDLSIEIRGYRVADKDNPMRNLFDIGRIHSDLLLLPLLEKKFVINELALQNASFNTPRKTSGALKHKEKKKVEKKKSGKPLINIDLNFNMNSIMKEFPISELMDKQSLKSIELVKQINTESEQKLKNWEQKVDSIDYKADSDEAQSALKDLQTIKEVNTLDDITSAKAKIDRVRAIQKKLSARVEEMKSIKKDFDADKEYFTDVTKTIKNATTDDYNKVLKDINLNQFNLKNLSKGIFGAVIYSKIEKAMGIVEKVRKFIPKDKKSDNLKKEKKKEKKMIKGINVAFPKEKSYPGFLIKLINVSGESKLENNAKLLLNGTIKGITSDQDLYGAPLVIDLEGKKIGDGGYNFLLNGTIDHRKNIDQEKFELAMKNIDMSGFSFGSSSMLPPKFEKGEGFVDFEMLFASTSYIMNLDAGMKNIKLQKVEYNKSNQLESIVQNIYSDLNIITLKSQYKSDANGDDFSLTSNLDEYFNQQMRKILDQKIQEVKDKVKAELDARINKARAELDSKLNGRWQELQSKFGLKQTSLDSTTKQLTDAIANKDNLMQSFQDKQKQKAQEAVEQKKEEVKEEAKQEVKEQAKQKLKSLFK